MKQMNVSMQIYRILKPSNNQSVNQSLFPHKHFFAHNRLGDLIQQLLSVAVKLFHRTDMFDHPRSVQCHVGGVVVVDGQFKGGKALVVRPFRRGPLLRRGNQRLKCRHLLQKDRLDMLDRHCHNSFVLVLVVVAVVVLVVR